MRQLEVVPTFEAQLGGKILSNAHAVADVDGDDATELIFGSIAGDIAIFKACAAATCRVHIKGDRFMKWRSCSVDGSVTAICVDTSSASDARVFVATAEGSCYVVTESGDEFRVSSEFRVSLNVCDLAILDGDLVLGTRDGGLYIYRADANALGGYKQLEKFEIKREIEAFRLLAITTTGGTSSSQLVVCCASGEFFHVATLSEQQKKHTVQVWRAPSIETTTVAATGAADRVAYIVDGVRSADAIHAQIAVASLSGHVSVFTTGHEPQWSTKLPEAVVAFDKLSLSAPTGTSDVLVVCTWSGQLYAVASPDAVVLFRMLYPATTMFCADVYETAEQCERVLVGISTSGIIFVFRHLEDTLARALAHTSLATAVREREQLFAQIESLEKRRALVATLPRTALTADASAFTNESPTLEDLVQLAVLSPPASLTRA